MRAIRIATRPVSLAVAVSHPGVPVATDGPGGPTGSTYRAGDIARRAVACLVISCLALSGAAEAGLAASPVPPHGPSAPAALTWTRLDGMAEAFEGSILGLLERGPDGYLALGRSQTTGLPRAWRSTDGLAWERVPLPPTTFGGGQPDALVWGPEGWVALGWQVTLKHGVRQQVWLSPDGVTWEPDPDPSGILTTTADYVGPGPRWRIPGRGLYATDGSVVIGESRWSGPSTLRTSRDGRAWTPPVDQVNPGDITSVPWPADEDPSGGYEVVGPRGLLYVDYPIVRATGDGQAWTESRYPGHGENLEFLGWDGGWIAYAEEAVGDGIWYSADGSNWTAGTIPDPGFGRQEYLSLVSLDSSRVLAIERYLDVITAAWIGTFGSPAEPPQVTMTGTEPVDPAVDPNIVPLVTPPGTTCPPRPRTLRRLFRIPGWKAAVCFGDERIRAVGPALKSSEQPGASGTAYDNTLFVGDSRWGYAPILGRGPIEYGNGVHDVVMVGHFVDRSCATDPTGYPTPAAGLLDCQETFTPTSIRPVRR